MTTTATEPGAEVDAPLASAKTLVASGKASLGKIIAALVPPAWTPDPGDAAPPGPPKRRELTAVQRKALDTVPAVFSMVHPTERRELTPTERTLLMEEQETLRLAAEALKLRDEDIKEIVRVHLDCQAEREDRPRPLAKDGHYIVAGPKKPYTAEAPGTGSSWSQEYVSGTSEPSPEKLLAAYEAGVISRVEYLGMTREVRVLDPEKISGFLRRNPARGLEILRKITVRGVGRTSLYIRDSK